MISFIDRQPNLINRGGSSLNLSGFGPASTEIFGPRAGLSAMLKIGLRAGLFVKLKIGLRAGPGFSVIEHRGEDFGRRAVFRFVLF